MPTELPVPMILSAGYTQQLGLFYSNWSAIDLFTDYAIYQFLKVTPEQAHLITSGMMFGRKARLLDDLLRHSNDPKRPEILKHFNVIRAAKREVIAHAYVASEIDHVTFLERSISGQFVAKKYTFTMDEFYEHVQRIATAARGFYLSLNVTQEELNAFAEAAFNLNSKSTTSPGSPLSSK